MGCRPPMTSFCRLGHSCSQLWLNSAVSWHSKRQAQLTHKPMLLMHKHITETDRAPPRRSGSAPECGSGPAASAGTGPAGRPGWRAWAACAQLVLGSLLLCCAQQGRAGWHPELPGPASVLSIELAAVAEHTSPTLLAACLPGLKLLQLGTQAKGVPVAACSQGQATQAWQSSQEPGQLCHVSPHQRKSLHDTISPVCRAEGPHSQPAMRFVIPLLLHSLSTPHRLVPRLRARERDSSAQNGQEVAEH